QRSQRSTVPVPTSSPFPALPSFSTSNSLLSPLLPYQAPPSPVQTQSIPLPPSLNFLSSSSHDPPHRQPQRHSFDSSSEALHRQCSASGSGSSSTGASAGAGTGTGFEGIETAIVIKSIPFAATKEQVLALMASLSLPIPRAFNFHQDSLTAAAKPTLSALPPPNGLGLFSDFELESSGKRCRDEYFTLLTSLASPPRFLSEELDLNDPATLDIYSLILLFRDDALRDEFGFARSLSTSQRRVVHLVAKKLGLQHRSVGEEGQGGRRVVVSKGEMTTLVGGIEWCLRGWEEGALCFFVAYFFLTQRSRLISDCQNDADANLNLVCSSATPLQPLPSRPAAPLLTRTAFGPG
ncbi:hypothetical protein JCM11641_007764, partial [Rhodosporidiobolus odoratus]